MADHDGSALIAIVEDDAMQLVAMELLLESWGYRVLAVSTPQELLEASLRDAPDVIVSDYRLPGSISGMEAVESVRQAIGHNIPAVLQTGDTTPSLLEEAQGRGYIVLHKPYDPKRLRSLLDEFIRGASAA